MASVLEEPTDVLAADHNIAWTLLDGAGGGITLAAATATYRLLHKRQEQKGVVHRSESDEVKALRRIVDNVLLFLVGRKGADGLPDTEGFIERFEMFQREVRGGMKNLQGSLGAVTEQLQVLTDEWQPNGGNSSYDRLRRLEERGGPNEPRS